MEDNLDNEVQLAKWLNGQLSPEEKMRLNQDGSLDELQKIVDEVDTWHVKPLNTETGYSTLRGAQVKSEEAKIIPIYQKGWFIGVAASIALLLGFWISISVLPNEPIQYATSNGQHLEITFPDQSTASLGPNSAIQYDEESWSNNPNITITGRAYFQGPHTKNFTVSWPTGSVIVTGTRFDVFTGNDISTVKCYEGEITSNVSGASNILHRGEGIRTINGKTELIEFNSSSPTWLSGKYTFRDAPLSEVIQALESEFGVVIKNEDISSDRSYTGGFDSGDVEQSLKMVFTPLNINFSKKGNIVVLTE